MKRIHIYTITALFMFLMSGCKSNVPPSNEKYFLIGAGSFINGANWDIKSGLEFQVEDNSNKKISKLYSLKDEQFQIGDTFRIVNSKGDILSKDVYTIKEGSFASNNVKFDELNPNKNQVDILYSGKYDINLSILNNGSVSISVDNSSGTLKNTNESFQGNETIDFYANGDLHGMTLETKEGSITYPSIASYIGYAKSQIQNTGEDTSLLISNGDLWQGSLASNSNYGMMMNEIFDKAGYETFTFGNHEFDWGVDKIASNQSYTTNMEYLGANIVYKDTQEMVDFASPYKIVIKNGVKIGIIGVIGKAQITSITSTYVLNIEFLDTVEVIKKYSDKLRTVFNCDLVIACFHEGTSGVETSIRNYLSKNSTVSGRRYLDGAFSAHDHTYAVKNVNRVPIVNSGKNGRFLSHFSLNINNGVVTCNVKEILGNNPSSSSISLIYEFEEDQETLDIVNRYYTDEIKEKGETILTTLENEFDYRTSAPNLMAKAMFETIEKTGYDIDVSIVNQGRQSLSQGDLTYYNLLSCFPFFNKTVVFKVKGSDLIKVSSYNCYSDNPFDIDVNKEYTVATYDYIAYHQNQYREYDNFSSINPIFEYSIYPVDLLAAYIKDKNTSLNNADFTGTNYNFLRY